MKFLFWSVVALLPVSLSGCVAVAPVLEALRDLNATPADRRNSFQKSFKEFREGLLWADRRRVEGYLLSRRVGEGLFLPRDEGKVTGIEIVDGEFDDGAFIFDGVIKITRFRQRSFLVEELREEQRWEFGRTSGWQLTERREVDSKK